MEASCKREACNKGKLVSQKPPLKPNDISAIRIYLQNAHAARNLAMFNLAIDRKLRDCDLVGLRGRDITYGSPGACPGHGGPEEDAAARPVRIDRADENGSVSLAGKSSFAERPVSFSESGG